MTKSEMQSMRRMARASRGTFFRDCWNPIVDFRYKDGEDVLFPMIPASRRNFEMWASFRAQDAKMKEVGLPGVNPAIFERLRKRR